MFNKNLHLEVFKNSIFEGRRNMGARGATAPQYFLNIFHDYICMNYISIHVFR